MNLIMMEICFLQTGKSRGFAFVYFDSVKSATNAKNDCSGMEIDGRRIRVDYSITQRAHTPTPGIYMGRPTTGLAGKYGSKPFRQKYYFLFLIRNSYERK